MLNSLSRIATPLNGWTGAIGKWRKPMPGHLSVRGQWTVHDLPKPMREFVLENARLMLPGKIFVCEGGEMEDRRLISILRSLEIFTEVSNPKYKNCWWARSDERDGVRLAASTFTVSRQRVEAVPETMPGYRPTLGNWMSIENAPHIINQRFRRILHERVMYVVPFVLGPVGSPVSRFGVAVTDSPLVVWAMKLMTVAGRAAVTAFLQSGTHRFIKLVHAAGTDRRSFSHSSWECDPAAAIILHLSATDEIFSYGSQYPDNCMMTKNLCIRLGAAIGYREGWLGEHMVVFGVKTPTGKKYYFAAALPSVCGKSTLGMMLNPALPGYKIECVTDDVAWIKFNEKTKMLHAYNPLRGFFGAVDSTRTVGAIAAALDRNTVFINTGRTSDGGVYWDTMPKPEPGVKVTDWNGNEWNGDRRAAHPNARFITPIGQCPAMDPRWDDPEGVPVSGIIFGSRRSYGYPLVFEPYSWNHAIFLATALRTDPIKAATKSVVERTKDPSKRKERKIWSGMHFGYGMYETGVKPLPKPKPHLSVKMHDPFAIRSYISYNMGDYIRTWMNIPSIPGIKLPKVFYFNPFRLSPESQFLWPGFGENVRALEWMIKRIEGNRECAARSALGYLPTDLNLDGIDERVQLDLLFNINPKFWSQELREINIFFKEQLPRDIPVALAVELSRLHYRLLHPERTDQDVFDQ